MSGLNIVDFHTPLGYVQSTSFSSAAGLPDIPSGAQAALIVIESQTVRWRDDGTNPTSSIGMLLNTNTEYLFVGNLTALKFIQTAATATINVSYYK